jgi:hypothetical protein
LICAVLPDLADIRPAELDDFVWCEFVLCEFAFCAGLSTRVVPLDCVARTMAFTSESLPSERHRSTRCRLAIERNSFSDLAFSAAAVITYRFSQVQGA